MSGEHKNIVELARTPFCVTFAADSTAHGRKLLLKVYSVEANGPTAASALSNTMRAISECRNNRIVNPLEIGRTANGDPYVARTYLDSPTLNKLEPIDEGNASGWTEQLCWIGAGIVSAIRPLHAMGHAHGAIHESNIFIHDVGMTALVDPAVWFPHRTFHMDFATQNAHVAPELFTGKPPTEAGDVYSLGSVLRNRVSNDTFESLPEELREVLVASRSQRVGDRPSTDELFHVFEQHVSDNTLLPQPFSHPNPFTIAALGHTEQAFLPASETHTTSRVRIDELERGDTTHADEQITSDDSPVPGEDNEEIIDLRETASLDDHRADGAISEEWFKQFVWSERGTDTKIFDPLYLSDRIRSIFRNRRR